MHAHRSAERNGEWLDMTDPDLERAALDATIVPAHGPAASARERGEPKRTRAGPRRGAGPLAWRVRGQAARRSRRARPGVRLASGPGRQHAVAPAPGMAETLAVGRRLADRAQDEAGGLVGLVRDQAGAPCTPPRRHRTHRPPRQPRLPRAQRQRADAPPDRAVPPHRRPPRQARRDAPRPRRDPRHTAVAQVNGHHAPTHEASHPHAVAPWPERASVSAPAGRSRARPQSGPS